MPDPRDRGVWPPARVPERLGPTHGPGGVRFPRGRTRLGCPVDPKGLESKNRPQQGVGRPAIDAAFPTPDQHASPLLGGWRPCPFLAFDPERSAPPPVPCGSGSSPGRPGGFGSLLARKAALAGRRASSTRCRAGSSRYAPSSPTILPLSRRGGHSGDRGRQNGPEGTSGRTPRRTVPWRGPAVSDPPARENPSRTPHRACAEFSVSPWASLEFNRRKPSSGSIGSCGRLWNPRGGRTHRKAKASEIEGERHGAGSKPPSVSRRLAAPARDILLSVLTDLPRGRMARFITSATDLGGSPRHRLKSRLCRCCASATSLPVASSEAPGGGGRTFLS